MHKDWTEIAKSLTVAVKEVRVGIPEAMKGFSALAAAANAPGVLDAKTKELISLGISIAVRCDGCIAFHAKAAVEKGASRAEVMETAGMSVYMGGGPSLMYAAQALEAYDQFAAAKP
ncbi:MAG: carboxymuconolactone decarboxylase family protein [Alphaproteobacteria bacterium]|nr:carboxymuconolactone decarboxylase family protein [Alphaproteobacteria bacterium]